VDALLRSGHAVRCFDRAGLPALDEELARHARFEFREGDITSEGDMAAAVDGCDVLLHLVSTTLPKSSNADPVFDVESNLVSTIRLLDLAVKAGMRKVVFASSGGTVYGDTVDTPILETHPTDPVCSYGITKLAIEKYLHLFQILHGLDYTVLRLANPYGERQRLQASQGAVAVFMGKILGGEPIEIWGDGSVVRDYIYVGDVADALLAAIERTGTERVFNIGSGRGHSLNELIDSIEAATGRTAVRTYMPARNFDVPSNVLSIARAREGLGWAPKVSFDVGLKKFADWIRVQKR
jgi:UDP-glucose 4-epimerase